MTLSPGSIPSAGPEAARRAPVGSIVMLVLGSLLALAGFAALAGGISAAGFTAAQNRDGFITSQRTLLATDTYALTTPGAAAGTAGGVGRALPFDIGQVRLTAEGAKPVFIGIAPQADVDRYLSNVHRTAVSGLRYRPFEAEYRDLPGTAAPRPPGEQTFWVESAAGSGAQRITWTITPGDWAVVLMNADGTPRVSAHIQV
ncbi:MAG: hypothetical protein QOJ68_3655, partial [Blastococcus sp.]|nr:hypothetical protein [Blastococcus sp.]